MMRGPGRWIAGALGVLAFLSTLAVVLLTGFLVVARFAEISVVGLHEFILLAAMLMYMVGAVMSSCNRSHLAVDWLETRLESPRAKASHRLLVAVITTVITVFFVYWTFKMLAWGVQRPQWTPAFGIPLWLPQASLMLGAVGCCCFGLRDVLVAAGELRAARESGEGGS